MAADFGLPKRSPLGVVRRGSRSHLNRRHAPQAEFGLPPARLASVGPPDEDWPAGDIRSYFGTIFWSPLGDPGGGTTGIVESEDGNGLLIPASPTGGGRITPVSVPSR